MNGHFLQVQGKLDGASVSDPCDTFDAVAFGWKDKKVAKELAKKREKMVGNDDRPLIGGVTENPAILQRKLRDTFRRDDLKGKKVYLVSLKKPNACKFRVKKKSDFFELVRKAIKKSRKAGNTAGLAVRIVG